MPRKLRRQKLRTDVLSMNQRGHLCSGCYWWSAFRGEAEFQDEDHRRAAWEHHRERILTEWDRPGRRPVAMWEYDLGDWSRYGESEEEAVHTLLAAGRIEACHINGIVPIDNEVTTIEAEWRHGIRVALTHCSSYEAAREVGCGADSWAGVPVAFWDAEAPAIQAQQEAEMEAWHRQYPSARDGDAGKA